jgi:hypothetical protein
MRYSLPVVNVVKANAAATRPKKLKVNVAKVSAAAIRKKPKVNAAKESVAATRVRKKANVAVIKA